MLVDPGQAARNDQTWGQGQSEGSRENPVNVPESPVQPRRGSNSSGSNATLFNRMRDAFGGGGGGGAPSGAP